MTTGIGSCLLLWVNLLMHFSKIEAICAGNGLMNSCACNFIGACTYDASKNTFNAFTGSSQDLRKYIPNVTPLAAPQMLTTEICEPGNFGIIYDCNNRIPLAATIVMTADQYNDPKYTRPTNKFKKSSEMTDPNFQQNDNDYEDALKRKICYESQQGNVYIERNWYRAKNNMLLSLLTACPSTIPQDIKSPVHRGHLIASNYGRGTPGLIRSQQTFVYTNAVPQFGGLNSGSWQKHEGRLIDWAKKHCNVSPLHVIVGSIPSTYGKNEQRFFGGSGFSDFIGPSNTPGNGYRVNVPSYLWTAACCSTNSFTKSTTFFAENAPRGFSQQSVELSKLFSVMNAKLIILFPGMPSCNDDNNFISIYS